MFQGSCGKQHRKLLSAVLLLVSVNSWGRVASWDLATGDLADRFEKGDGPNAVCDNLCSRTGVKHTSYTINIP